MIYIWNQHQSAPLSNCSRIKRLTNSKWVMNFIPPFNARRAGTLLGGVNRIHPLPFLPPRTLEHLYLRNDQVISAISAPAHMEAPEAMSLQLQTLGFIQRARTGPRSNPPPWAATKKRKKPPGTGRSTPCTTSRNSKNSPERAARPPCAAWKNWKNSLDRAAAAHPQKDA